jgi:hypothetical protein
MICNRCRKKFEEQDSRCPHCGQTNRANSGTVQTSVVLISASGADRVYRSVDEVPARLRTRLLKSTNGQNSATILIADRRGRKEISRAMRKLPNTAQRRLMRSILASDAATGTMAWLTPARRMALMVAIALCCVALIAIVFTHRW